MADDRPNRPVASHNNLNGNGNSEPVENGLDNNDMQNRSDTLEGDRNLRDFVTRNYHDQRVSGAAGEMTQADEARRNNFFQRAISESQRMSAEVDRCKQRHDELQEELGAGNLHAWTMEHASQVTVTLPDPEQPQTPPVLELHDSMDYNK